MTDIKLAVRSRRPSPPLDSFTLSTASEEDEKAPGTQPRSLKTDSYPMYQQLAEQDCLTNLRQNANISPELREKLCKIINGGLINTGNNDDTSKKDFLGELMHLWYDDIFVVSEIYNTLRRNGQHITKEIKMLANKMDEAHRIFIGNDGDWKIKLANDNEVYYYYMVQTVGDSEFKFRDYLDVGNFKRTQIDKYLLNDQLFAIPFGVGGNYLGSHANMLIIKQYNDEKYDKPVIECEHFEPHGQYYMAEQYKEKSDFIINRVWELIHLLFDPAKYKIIVLNPNQICPLVEKFDTLQGLTSGDFGGSCAVFSLWYMFLRLLNPSRSRSETYYLMNNFLKSSHSANDIMRQIIETFTSLVTVDLTTVNGIPLMQDTREMFEQSIFPDGVFPTEGGRINPPKPTRKKKNVKTVKKRNKKNKKTIKIINSKHSKTRIKRKNTIPNIINRHDLTN
jgi:hypothetical protein